MECSRMALSNGMKKPLQMEIAIKILTIYFLFVNAGWSNKKKKPDHNNGTIRW